MNTINILSSISLMPLLAGVITTLYGGHHYKNTRIPGLLFHSILPKPRLNLSHFPLDIFEDCINELFNNKFTPITVTAAAQTKNILPSDKKCIITFDDGLENVFHTAIPCLNTYNYKASIFCVAGFSGKLSAWDIYKESRHLNTMQIRQLSDWGHEIGSHSLTHSNLTFLTNENLITELRDSKRILEDITGKPVTSLSFPHGSWNKRIWDCACEQGYHSATLYRGHLSAKLNMFPVIGVTRFDSTRDIIQKLSIANHFSPSIASSRIASHFAKGTPLWKFRKNYQIIQHYDH